MEQHGLLHGTVLPIEAETQPGTATVVCMCNDASYMELFTTVQTSIVFCSDIEIVYLVDTIACQETAPNKSKHQLVTAVPVVL